MRTSDRAAGGELFDALGADVVIQRTQSFDDAPPARLPRVAKLPQLRIDPFIMRVERIREDMDVDAFVRTRQLRCRNQRHAFRIRVRLYLKVRREIVMIADG